MNRGRHLAFLFAGAVLFFSGSLSIQAQPSSYSGRATGVVSVGPTTATAGDTCPLPSTGGTVTMTTPSSSMPGITTGTIISTTSGAGTTSQSSSTVNNVNITAGAYNIRATTVSANTQCTCCPGAAEPTCTGNTNISGLTVTGPSGAVPVTITGAANQTVVLPDGAGTITINEQIVAVNEITVNAIHVNITSGGATTNAIIASAHSDIICGSAGPSPADVNVAGKVVDTAGRGIPNATVRLTGTTGTQHSALSSPTGQFTIQGVTAGDSYQLVTTHKSYQFSPRLINVQDEITDLVITAQAP